MRMAVDNAVLSGNLIVEVDETNLVPGQDLSLYPEKYLEDKAAHPVRLSLAQSFQTYRQRI